MRLEKATPDHLKMLDESINLSRGNYNVHNKIAKSLSGGPVKKSFDLLTLKGKVSIAEDQEHKAYIKFKSEGYNNLAEVILLRIKRTNPVEVLSPPNAKPKKAAVSESSTSSWGKPRPIRSRRPSSQSLESLERKLERLGINPFGTAVSTNNNNWTSVQLEDTPEEGETLEF